MRAWLIDCYRSADKIVCWFKTPDENIRIESEFNPKIYLEICEDSLKLLRLNKIWFVPIEKKTYDGKKITVLEVSAPVAKFESFVRWIERSLNHSVRLYNADVKPEQMFMFEKDFVPFSVVETERMSRMEEEIPAMLSHLKIKVFFVREEVSAILFDDLLIECDEEYVLEEFARRFKVADPDVILMDNAFSVLPVLCSRLDKYSIKVDFHRWDDVLWFDCKLWFGAIFMRRRTPALEL